MSHAFSKADTQATIDSSRIACLDGWRGIAILLVLFDHLQDALLHHYARPWAQTGQHGVTIFFVLSGFLITTKLAESPIDLKRFFVRRFFRLIPVAWLYLVAMLVFDRVMHTQFTSWREVGACLFFYRNFVGVAGGGATGHFWSLSLEEQFYLVWPVLMLLFKVRKCRWIAGIGAWGCASYRWVEWAHYDHNLVDYQTQVRADALLVGCLAALLVAEPRVRQCVVRWRPIFTLAAGAGLVYSMATFHWLVPLGESVSIAILILASMVLPGERMFRPLSLAPLAWLGRISYSVYVWQALFMLPWSEAVRPWLLGFGLPVISMGSYYWIERPLTALGRRLTAGPDKVDNTHEQQRSYRADTNDLVHLEASRLG